MPKNVIPDDALEKKFENIKNFYAFDEYTVINVKTLPPC